MQTAAISSFHALRSQGHSFIEIIGMMQDQLSGIADMAAANGLEKRCQAKNEKMKQWKIRA